jgi:hypothetical protein
MKQVHNNQQLVQTTPDHDWTLPKHLACELHEMREETWHLFEKHSITQKYLLR